jgi:hypothetical protein
MSKPRFNGQKRSEMSVIALEATGERYGWVGWLSTAPERPREAVNLSVISRK